MIILCLYTVGMVNEVAVVNAKFPASILFLNSINALCSLLLRRYRYLSRVYFSADLGNFLYVLKHRNVSKRYKLHFFGGKICVSDKKALLLHALSIGGR